MATEGFLLRDGGQCQAAANYWNPATKLFGQAGSGQFLAVTLTPARTVTLATAGASTTAIYGILQNSPDQGQAADVGLFGISKAVAGAVPGAIVGGSPLMLDGTNAGTLILWVTGSHNLVVGFALEAASAANQIFTVYLTPQGGYRA
jgi:hypothetical protein